MSRLDIQCHSKQNCQNVKFSDKGIFKKHAKIPKIVQRFKGNFFYRISINSVFVDVYSFALEYHGSKPDFMYYIYFRKFLLEYANVSGP